MDSCEKIYFYLSIGVHGISDRIRKCYKKCTAETEINRLELISQLLDWSFFLFFRLYSHSNHKFCTSMYTYFTSGNINVTEHQNSNFILFFVHFPIAFLRSIQSGNDTQWYIEFRSNWYWVGYFCKVDSFNFRKTGDDKRENKKCIYCMEVFECLMWEWMSSFVAVNVSKRI